MVGSSKSSAAISGMVSVTMYWCCTGMSGRVMPAKAATSRAHRPAALTTNSARIVPSGVSTSQPPSGRGRVAMTGAWRFTVAPSLRAAAA
jgi:hypothetical protein